MRQSGYVFSFALAGLVFFSVPVLANSTLELPSAIDLSSTIAAEKGDAHASSPDALAVKDAPADEVKDSGKPTLLERAKAALAGSDAPLLSDDEVCTTLVEVAQANELPVGFFTNLIWRESRFDHAAI